MLCHLVYVTVLLTQKDITQQKISTETSVVFADVKLEIGIKHNKTVS